MASSPARASEENPTTLRSKNSASKNRGPPSVPTEPTNSTATTNNTKNDSKGSNRRRDTSTSAGAIAKTAPNGIPAKPKTTPQTNGRTPSLKPRPPPATSSSPTRPESSPRARLPAGKDTAHSSPDGRSSRAQLSSPSKQLWDESRRKWSSPAQRSPRPRNGSSPRSKVRASMINLSPPSKESSKVPPRRRRSLDSPSKQLWEEFSRMILDSDYEFQHRLEESSACQRDQHHAALQEAVARHEYVRKSAETAKRRAEVEDELERKVKEEEELRALRKLQQAAHEAELRRQAEFRTAEAQKRAMEQEKQQKEREELERVEKETRAAEAERVKKTKEAQQAAEEEQRRVAQAEADRKAKEAADLTKRSSSQIVPPPPQAITTTAAGSFVEPTRQIKSRVTEDEHNKYLQIHKDLKALRKACRGQQNLKATMSEMRRMITRSLGQLTLGKGVNKQPTDTVRGAIAESLNYATPSVDIRKFLANPPSDIPDADCQVPMLLVYCLNIFSKGFFEQLASEANVTARNADPIGVLAASVFADPRFHWHGHSLIDILLAKFHKVCPVLWGVYGSEKKENGRERIGWGKYGGEWISQQLHTERMTAFGAGYAALSLRDFGKSKQHNPYPPTHFWTSLSRITNVPAAEVQPTHLYVLKSLIDLGAERFIGFFGKSAIVALRHAIVEFPAAAPKGVAATAVGYLPETLAKDFKIYI